MIHILQSIKDQIEVLVRFKTFNGIEDALTAKGEKLGTLARIHFGHRGEVFRLLAACPLDRFDVAREELVEILDSFRLDALPESK